jgi:hypothetical protein
MNRRTLLKVAAASSGVLLGSRFELRHSFAQAPAYTAESVYEFTEFTKATYSPFTDGYFWGATSDGKITGRDLVDGKLVPVTWDLSGTRALLDMGDIPFATTRAVVPGPMGYLVGNVSEVDDPAAPSVGVLWTDGVPSLVDPNATGSVNANTVNSSGVVAGAVDGAPARWVDGQASQLPIPEGAEWSAIYALAGNGDAYGTSAAGDSGVGTVFKWTVDGSVENIALPDEVTANGLVKVMTVAFPGVFDNGSFVLSINWEDASGFRSGSWIYDGGVATRVQTSGANTDGRVSDALDASNMIGYINAGEGDALGFTGPTQWIDGAPYSLDALTTLPPGLPMSNVRGITADGVLLATTFSLGSESPPAHILVLRPAS